MELIYKANYRLRQSDFRPSDTLSSHAILEMLQDVSGEHAATINMSYEDFIKRNLVWMIVQTKYVIYSDVPMYKYVDCYTWPREKGKLDFFRDYKVICDDKICIRAVMRWVIVDNTTRHVYIPRDIKYDGEFYKDDDAIEIDRLKDFSVEGLTPYVFKPNFMDLDHNGHINNTKYAYYLENALELKEQIKSFSISYNKELKYTDELKIYIKKEDSIYYAKGEVNNELCFLAKVEGK